MNKFTKFTNSYDCLNSNLCGFFQTIFSEFITIEMLFHGKALEVYTAAYQNIQKIDEEEDLEVGLYLSKLSSYKDGNI